jgi:hypothetical protein
MKTITMNCMAYNIRRSRMTKVTPRTGETINEPK